MTILITGGSGLIGTALIKVLSQSEKIISIDIKKPVEEVEGVIYLKQHISDLQFPPNVEGVIHLAAMSRVITAENDPWTTYTTNVNGTYSIISKLEEIGHKPWIIYGSSREVYGESTVFPVNESCITNPINHYGISKVAAEGIVKLYCKKGGKGFSLRFSNVYGGNGDHLDRVIPKFIIQSLTGENLEVHGAGNTFDFTHVDDTVKGIINSINYLRNKAPPGFYETLNICTGKETSLLELAEKIKELTRSSSTITVVDPRSFDVKKYIGDTKKAEKLIDYSPTFSVSEGLRAYIPMIKRTLQEMIV